MKRATHEFIVKQSCHYDSVVEEHKNYPILIFASMEIVYQESIPGTCLWMV